MESIYSHRKTPYSGYMPSHHNRTWDPMDSWVMHDEDAGVTAPRSIMNWTPEDEELTREITRQEELGNKEKARELMTELNKQNREKGIDFEYYMPGEDDW